MPRPKKPKSERKELTLRVRCTAEQRAKLDDAAGLVGAPTSTWLLGVGLREARKTEGKK